MIARKITYHGNFNDTAVGEIYNITRDTEITGQVKKISDHEIELNLEGDPSFIKLIQHRIERKVKSLIKDKTVVAIPYQYYIGVTLFI
jgi:hypothetical protein